MMIFRVIKGMLRDVFLYIGSLILVVIIFSYLFSAFGVFFAIALLEPLMEEPTHSTGFIIALVGEIFIIASWIVLLVLEVQRRISIIKREQT